MYSKGLINFKKYLDNERDLLLIFRDKFEELIDIINSSFDTLKQKIN